MGEVRKFAIGDIHGRLDRLKDLTKKIDPVKEDTLIFLGDYIDRGTESKEVVDFLLELAEKTTCVFLTGNHEQILLDVLEGRDSTLYLNNGGDATCRSYVKGKELDFIPRETLHSRSQKSRNLSPTYREAFKRAVSFHIDFFDTLGWYYEDDDYICVHAGIDTAKPSMDDQELETLVWVREEFMTSRVTCGKKIIFGHTPFKEPLIMYDKIGIDTGAFTALGKLTAIQLPEETFIHSF